MHIAQLKNTVPLALMSLQETIFIAFDIQISWVEKE